MGASRCPGSAWRFRPCPAGVLPVRLQRAHGAALPVLQHVLEFVQAGGAHGQAHDVLRGVVTAAEQGVEKAFQDVHGVLTSGYPA